MFVLKILTFVVMIKPAMKTGSILLLGLGFLLSACVKDEEGYSEFIQNYLDEITYLDTVSVDLDVPCTTPQDMILYYTYDDSFTEFECNDNEEDGYEVIAFDEDDDIYLYLTFKSRPVPGKYVTDYFYGNAPSTDSEVVMEYFTPAEDFLTLDGDTIYVEKISGGVFVFSFCDVQIDAGWGGYYASGNFEVALADYE